MNKKNLVLALIFVISLLLLGGGAGPRPNETNNPSSTDVLIAGHMYEHWDDRKVITRRLGLHNWDSVIFAGDAIGDQRLATQAEVESDFSTIADKVSFIIGDEDDVESESSATVQDYDNARILLLDIPVDNDCVLSSEQIEAIKDSSKISDDKALILVTHYPLWGSTTSEHLKYNDQLQSCNWGWEDEILPLFNNKLDVAVSGDGGQYQQFKDTTIDNVRYVLTGAENRRDNNGKLESKLITMIRLNIDGSGRVRIDDYEMGNTIAIDNVALAKVPTYAVEIDEAKLKEVYVESSFYDVHQAWNDQILSPEDEKVIQQKIPAKVTDITGEEGREATIAIRGASGTHWAFNKKSWDLEFTDRDARQIKLIIPEDRGYINQAVAAGLSEMLGVPTPEISAARLVLNGIDFGIYLVIEDLDKPFVELRGYNSDAAPSKNIFPDHYGLYNILTDIGYGEVTGKGNDFSDQQNIASVELNPENVTAVFDAENLARWTAIQVFTGNRHQQNAANFRYIIDKATGRYIMISWDVYIDVIDVTSLLPEGQPQRAYWQGENNNKIMRKYVSQLMNSDQQINAMIDRMDREIMALMLNDPGMTDSEKIARMPTNLKSLIKKNTEKLAGQGY